MTINGSCVDWNSWDDDGWSVRFVITVCDFVVVSCETSSIIEIFVWFSSIKSWRNNGYSIVVLASSIVDTSIVVRLNSSTEIVELIKSSKFWIIDEFDSVVSKFNKVLFTIEVDKVTSSEIVSLRGISTSSLSPLLLQRLSRWECSSLFSIEIERRLAVLLHYKIQII